MSKKNNRTKERRELRDEYLPSGDKRSLRIEDLDLDAAVKRAAAYEEDVLIPEQEQKVKETIDTFDEVIETQERLLELFNPARMDVEVLWNRKLLKFHLRSVEAKDDLKSLQLDLSIYSDLSELEKDIMQKGAEDKESLTSSEKRLYEKTSKKLENKIAGSVLEQIHNVLATYVEPLEGPGFKSHREAVNFWKNVPFDLKTFLASTAMDRLGISPDSDVKLFQAG